MKQLSAAELQGLAVDIEAELQRLRQLADEVDLVRKELEQDPGRSWLYFENLALKLHNFYTGCERVFQLVAAELNGALPAAFDWHKRLLERMGVEWHGRPAVLSADSLHDLREYLAFRHVVRNIYGFELDEERVQRLVAHYPQVWAEVELDFIRFSRWLETLGERLLDEG